MVASLKMERWVKQEGTLVRFGNVVGGYIGTPYEYICDTEEQAIQFAEYLRERDPENDEMPSAVTDPIRWWFGAKIV